MDSTSFKTLCLLLLSILTRTKAFEPINCPSECHCTTEGVSVLVDCSGLGLSELPEFVDTQVHILDLSDNQFTTFPVELGAFNQLQYLDFSSNHIVRLKENSFEGLSSLRLLNLGKNNITSWAGISPNTLLDATPSLTELSLRENHFTSFSSNDESLLLISNSLHYLDLSNCKISKVQGQHVLRGLTALEHLDLSGNPIRSISNIISPSLTAIELNSCQLTNLQPTIFQNLPSLTHINLSRNHRISLQTKQLEYVQSESLKRIDLSYCNMDSIELEGFPNLLTAVLKGNMIRSLSKESFINTKLLENLDLSLNAITSISPATFKKLLHLKNLNLSFNMIPKIDQNTFKDNEVLTRLDLSRNYIGKFNRIVAVSLTNLNMSWCEINKIDPDALTGLPELVEVDLSNNLISDIPDALTSESLQTFDLSTNRINSIRNATFAGFTELTRINLSGNRFTVPFKTDFFLDNIYLSEIWLGDNPWVCNCHDPNLYKFHNFLMDPPAKIWDKKSLKCMSPEDTFGRTWENACYFTWYPQATMGTTEKVWTFFMVALIAFSGCMCIVMSIKRAIEGRQQTTREIEREANLELQRDISRQTNMRMRQEAQLNAPDPRESHPPCYEDALLLPRLDASFASLNELGRGRMKNKRRRKTENEEEDDMEAEVTIRRSRCRSEEVLSMRDVVLGTPRSPPMLPRVHPFEIGSPRESESERESISPGVHTPITKILTLEQSPRTSRSPRFEEISLPGPSEPVDGSFEQIRNFDKSNDNVGKSPYTKRKLVRMGSFKKSINDPVGSTSFLPAKLPNQVGPNEIVVVEDHFQNSSHASVDSVASEEFFSVNAADLHRDSSNRSAEDFTVVNRPSMI